MSGQCNNSSEVGQCLHSVYDTAQHGNTRDFAAKLTELLWALSDARPDLDQFPVNICRSEQMIEESGAKNDIASLGLCIRRIVLDSTARSLSKEAQGLLRPTANDLEKAAKRQDKAGVARAMRDVALALVEQCGSSSVLPVVQNDRSIHIGRHFNISFNRTLRIPDDGKTYPLPAGMGTFPIHSVADFADRVPAKWLHVGGFFLPMYQSEAMFLSFHGVSWRPNVAKVGVGKINAVSGKPWDERIHFHQQDYVLCPEQRWLDGINAGEGYVRQFVAMPLGQGYTVEEQVTDEDRFGGIQIVVYEPKKGVFPDEDPAKAKRRAEQSHIDTLLLEGVSNLPEPFRVVLRLAIMRFSNRQIASLVALPRELVERYEAAAKEECTKSRSMRYEAGMGAIRLVEDIQREGIRRLAGIVGTRIAEELSWRLYSSDAHDIRYSLAAPVSKFRSRDEATMGIAAGGKIKQKIVEDPYGADAWDENMSGSVWIHLVNSQVYHNITGEYPPEKPMEAADYRKLGIPWFSYYDEGRAAVAPSRTLSRIKSVFAIDQMRGRVNSPDASITVDPDRVVGIKIPTRKERIAALLSAAKAAASAGRYKSVSRLASAVLDLNSHNLQALCLRGEAHLHLGLYESARKDAEEVIESHSDNWTARRIRAEAALLLGMPELALVEASAALKLSKGDASFQNLVMRAQGTIRTKQQK